MLMVPPLATQARDFLAVAPDLLSRGQQWLIRQGILIREITIGEAVRQAPGAGTADAVGTVLVAIWGFVGGVFGVVTILIVAFYLLVDAEGIVRAMVRLFPRPERARVGMRFDEPARKSARGWPASCFWARSSARRQQSASGSWASSTSTCSPSSRESAS